MNKQYRMVKEFREAAGLPISGEPDAISGERLDLHGELISEEVVELLAATKLVDQVDACLDIIYLALGCLAEIGVQDVDLLFDVVQSCNMAKTRGKRVYRDDGKILKPSGWTGPEEQMERMLQEERR